ncbi:MAG: hypothetical protein LQ346_006331 [Caloplaca aetnensis]|nr:MAG: hypothetical protein LQ346_006331 [Caloplaca aetnensis]
MLLTFLSVHFTLLWTLFGPAEGLIQRKCNDFASNATVFPRPGVDSTLASDLTVALNFERSNWATGPVDEDPFYQVPSNASTAAAGSLLKLEAHTNTSQYTLPPTTALSRFLFQTKDFNGTAQPASAYILWPYHPRKLADGTIPVVAFAHGTSSGYGEGAPSHIRNLWYQFTAPFTLALQGYVVVAPDYLGLGVTKDANGKNITHPYLASASHANDLFYAVEAAQSAFPELSKSFVTFGHSQGGVAAWGAAQRQAVLPVEGFLGSIAASPGGSAPELLESSGDPKGLGVSLPFVLDLLVNGLSGIYPDFSPDISVTTLGLQRLQLEREIQGAMSIRTTLWPLTDVPSLVKDYWWRNAFFGDFFNASSIGGKPIARPLLVLQGDTDFASTIQGVHSAVEKTCKIRPDSQIEFEVYAGVGHGPVLYAAQRSWLGWIEDRFAGKSVQEGVCGRTSNFSSATDYAFSQHELNWYLEYATDIYETA